MLLLLLFILLLLLLHMEKQAKTEDKEEVTKQDTHRRALKSGIKSSQTSEQEARFVRNFILRKRTTFVYFFHNVSHFCLY